MAENWARPGAPATELASVREELEMAGAPPEIIEQAISELKPKPVHVLLENVTAVKAFLTAQTQWRQNPISGALIGLDYTAAQVAWQFSELTLSPDDFERVRFLERAAVQALQTAD